MIDLINKWWLEAVAWGILIPYMIYIWLYYSWQAFVINVLAGVFGLLAVLYFGHMMPIVGYFIRKWEKK